MGNVYSVKSCSMFETSVNGSTEESFNPIHYNKKAMIVSLERCRPTLASIRLGDVAIKPMECFLESSLDPIQTDAGNGTEKRIAGVNDVICWLELK